MFFIAPDDQAAALSAVRRKRAQIHEELTQVYQGYVKAAYIAVVEHTPQWTGHAAAQWNIGINHLDVSRSHLFLKDNLTMSRIMEGEDTKGAERPEAKKAGHIDAVDEAKRRQAGVPEQIRLGDIVLISNSVESLLTGGYATKLEANPNNYLRPENEGGHMVQKTVEWFTVRLKRLTPAQQAKFRLLKLSDSKIMETF